MNRPFRTDFLTVSLGLLALVAVSACGAAPGAHDSGETAGPRSPASQGLETADPGTSSSSSDDSEEAIAERELEALDPDSLERDPNPAALEQDASLNRLFALDALAGELARAIQDGFDGDDKALAQKLRDVEREIAWRRESLGRDAIDQARQLRLERLKRLPVVLR